MRNNFPPIYHKIAGQEGYKTSEEIIEHFKKKHEAKLEKESKNIKKGA